MSAIWPTEFNKYRICFIGGSNVSTRPHFVVYTPNTNGGPLRDVIIMNQNNHFTELKSATSNTENTLDQLNTLDRLILKVCTFNCGVTDEKKYQLQHLECGSRSPSIHETVQQLLQPQPTTRDVLINRDLLVETDNEAVCTEDKRPEFWLGRYERTPVGYSSILRDLRSYAAKEGFGFSVRNVNYTSTLSSDGKKIRVVRRAVFYCERSGVYVSQAVKHTRKTSTKFCACEWRVKLNSGGAYYSLTTPEGHNHPMSVIHSAIRSLNKPSKEDMCIIRDGVDQNTLPKFVMSRLLKSHDRNGAVQNSTTTSVVSSQQLYRIMAKMRKEKQGGKSDILLFLEQLTGGSDTTAAVLASLGKDGMLGSEADYDGNYLFAANIDSKTGEVKCVACFPKICVAMARDYPEILELDSTFNIVSIKGLRWLNMAGKTGVGKYFIIGGALMKGDEVALKDFIWVLEAVRKLVYNGLFPGG